MIPLSQNFSSSDLRARLDSYACKLEAFESMRKRLGLNQEEIARMLKVSRQTVNAAVNLDGSIRVIEQGIEVMKGMENAKTRPFKLVSIKAHYVDDDSEILVLQGKMGVNNTLLLSEGLYGYVHDWQLEDENGTSKLVTYPFLIFTKPNSPHGYINYGGEYLDEDYIECLDDLRLKTADNLVRVTKEGAYKYHINSIQPY